MTISAVPTLKVVVRVERLSYGLDRGEELK